MREKFRAYAKMNKLIIELKNDSMKPTHWRALLAKLGIAVGEQDLTLQHLWEKDLTRHEKIINQTLMVARGEMVLTEILQRLKSYWLTAQLELVQY